MTILRPNHNVLPEVICCCLQTCNFVVMFILMIVYKFLTSSELVCASYDHIYVPIIIYCLRPFVAVYKHVILL